VSVEQMTLGMLEILRGGGFTPAGSTSTQAAPQSIDRTDLFYAHIGGMDTMARALLAAASIVETADLDAFRDARYEGGTASSARRSWPTRPSRACTPGHVDGRTDQDVGTPGDAGEPGGQAHRTHSLTHRPRPTGQRTLHLFLPRFVYLRATNAHHETGARQGRLQQ
jgi:hypothetical protein